MDTTEIIHNALEWANKRLELQGEPITENQRNYIVFALRQQLTIPAVVVSEERAELCDNPNCEDGIVDRDYYGHPIYCQVCDKHN